MIGHPACSNCRTTVTKCSARCAGHSLDAEIRTPCSAASSATSVSSAASLTDRRRTGAAVNWVRIFDRRASSAFSSLPSMVTGARRRSSSSASSTSTSGALASSTSPGRRRSTRRPTTAQTSVRIDPSAGSYQRRVASLPSRARAAETRPSSRCRRYGPTTSAPASAGGGVVSANAVDGGEAGGFRDMGVEGAACRRR